MPVSSLPSAPSPHWHGTPITTALAQCPARADAAALLCVRVRRRYEPYCELQLLFERKLGAQLLRTFEEARGADAVARGAAGGAAAAGVGAAAPSEEDEYEALSRALPLALLLRVCRRVLDPSSLPALADERALVRALRRREDGRRDAALFRIAIRRAEASGRALAAGGVALLRGDALVSAHYRLGVGDRLGGFRKTLLGDSKNTGTA